ncbi:MAG: cytochrome c [Burkholderiales bacterium]|nr:cytochrome c [Burkholderiales bacterium]
MKSPVAPRKRFLYAAVGTALTAFMMPPSFGADSNGSQEQAALTLGKKLFTQSARPACALCHTLKDAGATGQVGPQLDELKPDARRVATAIKNGLGNMPAYRDTLTEEEIQALADYVARATDAAK